MRTSLIFALSTLALVASGGVGAAQDCENGYRTLGNGVIFLCEAPATGATPDPAEIEDALPPENLAADALPAEPATTGSTNALPDVSASEGAVSEGANPKVLEAESVQDCQPGQYYMMESDDATTPMMCR